MKQEVSSRVEIRKANSDERHLFHEHELTAQQLKSRIIKVKGFSKDIGGIYNSKGPKT